MTETSVNSVSSSTFFGKFSRAALELLISFLPFYVVALLLLVFGDPTKLWDRPDPALLSAVLFTEGWWKARSAKRVTRHERNALELYGVLGGITCCLVAAVFVLMELHVVNPLKPTVTANLGILHLLMFVLAVLYAFTVRFQVQDDE